AAAAVRALHRLRAQKSIDEFRGEIVRELGSLTRVRRPKPGALRRVRSVMGRIEISGDDGPEHSYFRRDLIEPSVEAKLPEELEHMAADHAARLGVDADAPVVCVHAREGGCQVGS